MNEGSHVDATPASPRPGETLADALGLGPRDLDRLCVEAPEHYLVYPIVTSGRKRWIEAPKAGLKSVQRLLLDRVLYRLPASSFAHGFVPGRSIVSNARVHCGWPTVVTMDLRKFFPSTTTDMVARALDRLPFGQPDRERIVLLTTRGGHLPQGAPTSPHLANLVARPMDFRLHGLAQASGWRYTRYADDLAFSGDGNPRGLVRAVAEIAAETGYQVARHKTRIMGRSKRQTVTGLVVNERVTLPREKRRLLRAALHRVRTRGWQSEGLQTAEQILGQVAFLCQVDRDRQAGLWQEMAALLDEPDPEREAGDA